jgi:NOL1/NOP2/fmu family ribosome biogenesis protein
MEFVFNTEKREIMKKLAYYGIDELPFLLIKSGKDKVRGYSGSLSLEEIRKLQKNSRVEIVGIYLFHEYPEEIRFSLDALHILKNQITKNIIELTKEQKDSWFRGEDILLTKEEQEKFSAQNRGFKVIKYKDDLIGMGKLTDDRITNYLPKERRKKGK